MAGLKKVGPKHKKRKYDPLKDKSIKTKLPTAEELKEEQEREFDEMKRLMEDAPTFKRHHGAFRQVK